MLNQMAHEEKQMGGIQLQEAWRRWRTRLKGVCRLPLRVWNFEDGIVSSSEEFWVP